MISIIAAFDRNRGLGFKNSLPWHLPDDLKRFKKLTHGHAVIMGRKTYESIGKALPGRKNIVITRQENYNAPDCVVVKSIDEALETVGGDLETFIIGGGEIYKSAISKADRMYLTLVDTEIEADVYFPDFQKNEWEVVLEEKHEVDEKHLYPFSFKILERI